jgi:hypothetical protein
MNSGLEAGFIIYYIFATLSISLNSFVVLYLIYTRRNRDWKFYSVILLNLHISTIAENFTAIPFIWKSSSALCLSTEAFKFYFGLQNVLSILVLIRGFSVSVVNPSMNHFTTQKLLTAQAFLIFFPTIVFLPFSDSTYQYPSGPWCSLPSSASIVWEVFIQYLWVWIMLLMAVLDNLRIIRKLYKHYDQTLLADYIPKVAGYTVVTFISWIPRTMVRLSHSTTSHEGTVLAFFSYFPMYVAGILFVFLFFKNIESINTYEDNCLEDLTFNPSFLDMITNPGWAPENGSMASFSDSKLSAPSLVMSPMAGKGPVIAIGKGGGGGVPSREEKKEPAEDV